MQRPEVLMVFQAGGILFEAPSAAKRREPFAAIRCPTCKGVGNVDMDQYEGKVSIDCGNCEYHETHNLREST